MQGQPLSRRQTRGLKAQQRDQPHPQLRAQTSRDSNMSDGSGVANITTDRHGHVIQAHPEYKQRHQHQHQTSIMHPNSFSNHAAIYGDTIRDEHDQFNRNIQAQVNSGIYMRSGGRDDNTYDDIDITTNIAINEGGYGGDIAVRDSRPDEGDIAFDDITAYDDTYLLQTMHAQQYPSQVPYVHRSRNTFVSRNRRGQSGRGGARDVDESAHISLVTGLLSSQPNPLNPFAEDGGVGGLCVGMSMGMGMTAASSDINSSGVTSSSASSLCGIEGFAPTLSMDESGCLTGACASPLPYDIEDTDSLEARLDSIDGDRGHTGTSSGDQGSWEPSHIVNIGTNAMRSHYSSVENFERLGEDPAHPVDSGISPYDFLPSGPASPRIAAQLGVNVRLGCYTTDSPGSFPLAQGVQLPFHPPSMTNRSSGTSSATNSLAGNLNSHYRATAINSKSSNSAFQTRANPNERRSGLRQGQGQYHSNFEFGPLNPDHPSDKAQSDVDAANSPVAYARYLHTNPNSNHDHVQNYDHGHQTHQSPYNYQQQQQEQASARFANSGGIELTTNPHSAHVLHTEVVTRGSSIASNSISNQSLYDGSNCSGTGLDVGIVWDYATATTQAPLNDIKGDGGYKLSHVTPSDADIDIADFHGIDEQHAHMFGLESVLMTPPVTPTTTSRKEPGE